MFDTVDITRRDGKPEDNFISHHPQELQDRFYDSRDAFYAVCKKTRRTRSIIQNGVALLQFGPMLSILVYCGLVGAEVINVEDASLILLSAILLLPIAFSVALGILGVERKVERKLDRWEEGVLSPTKEEFHAMSEEVNHYQVRVFGQGF